MLFTCRNGFIYGVCHMHGFHLFQRIGIAQQLPPLLHIQILACNNKVSPILILPNSSIVFCREICRSNRCSILQFHPAYPHIIGCIKKRANVHILQRNAPDLFLHRHKTRKRLHALTQRRVIRLVRRPVKGERVLAAALSCQTRIMCAVCIQQSLCRHRFCLFALGQQTAKLLRQLLCVRILFKLHMICKPIQLDHIGIVLCDIENAVILALGRALF